MTSSDPKDTIHITSQGKGGVFKSGVASLLTQYLLDRRLEVKAIDTDPTNATFSHYRELKAVHVDVTNGNNAVDISKFMAVADHVMDEPGPYVIDTGATIFLSFWDFVAQTQLLEFFASNGRRVVIHCPIMGGQELHETLKGFSEVCKVLPPGSIVAWLNSYHGAVERDGKPFSEFQVTLDNKDRLLGAVRLDEPIGSVRGNALRALCEKHQTFAEGYAQSRLLMKHVLHDLRQSIWAQLDQVI